MSHRPDLHVNTELVPEKHAQVVTLSGKLVGAPETYALLDDVRERIQQGLVRVCLDLSDVDLINSSGAGVLAAMCLSARRNDGNLVIAGLHDRPRKVLEFMRLQDFAVFVPSLDGVV